MRKSKRRGRRRSERVKSKLARIALSLEGEHPIARKAYENAMRHMFGLPVLRDWTRSAGVL